MQNLLNEYQRENKSLNQQVLDLLAENKALKIQKINSQALQLSDRYASKQSSSLGKSKKRDENLIEKMWKLKQEANSLENSLKKERKDSGVQVNVISEAMIEKKEYQKQAKGHKLLGSDTFSFGQNTVRQQKQSKLIEQKQDKACSPPKFIEVGEKEDEKDFK